TRTLRKERSSASAPSRLVRAVERSNSSGAADSIPDASNMPRATLSAALASGRRATSGSARRARRGALLRGTLLLGLAGGGRLGRRRLLLLRPLRDLRTRL